MHDLGPAFRASIFLLGSLTLSACNTDGIGGAGSGTNSAAFSSQPSAPPAAMAGRWLFSSPGRSQCNMTFGAANAAASEGTIAPEGGCPLKFFTSRKWTYDQTGLTMRDHNGQPLAQLSGAGGRFDGKATTGEPVALAR
jgi:predicted small secreted protein